MKINARFRLQVLVQNSLFVVLLIAIVASILYLTRDVNRQWDLTQGKNNTLSQASLDVLDEVSGPITITAFATTRDAEGNLRQEIQDFIAPYQRAKKDVSLTFVDPREDPGRATKAGVRLNGELVVEVNNRSENLATATEQAFTNLLVRLMRSSEQLIVALDGHGEGRFVPGPGFDAKNPATLCSSASVACSSTCSSTAARIDVVNESMLIRSQYSSARLRTVRSISTART